MRGRHSKVDQLQHGRMCRLIETRDRFIHAVNSQRVLDQVVGTDREKLALLGQRIRDQCRSRNRSSHR